ncbi:hypothetical protein WN943_020244 [Citrus x changshan-huyou]
MESSQYQTFFVKFGQSKLVKYFIHGNYFRIQFLKLERDEEPTTVATSLRLYGLRQVVVLRDTNRFNTKEEIMESKKPTLTATATERRQHNLPQNMLQWTQCRFRPLSHGRSQVTIN